MARTILIVDDDISVAEAICRLIERVFDEMSLGPTVVLVGSSPEDAVQIISHRRVDLMIVDYHLGEMTGHDLIKAVSGTGFQGIKILVTGDPVVLEELTTNRDERIDAVLSKPMSVQALKRTMKRLLQEGRPDP